jgi:hypothetical protein
MSRDHIPKSPPATGPARPRPFPPCQHPSCGRDGHIVRKYCPKNGATESWRVCKAHEDWQPARIADLILRDRTAARAWK